MGEALYGALERVSDDPIGTLDTLTHAISFYIESAPSAQYPREVQDLSAAINAYLCKRSVEIEKFTQEIGYT